MERFSRLNLNILSEKHTHRGNVHLMLQEQLMYKSKAAKCLRERQDDCKCRTAKGTFK